MSVVAPDGPQQQGLVAWGAATRGMPHTTSRLTYKGQDCSASLPRAVQPNPVWHGVLELNFASGTAAGRCGSTAGMSCLGQHTTRGKEGQGSCLMKCSRLGIACCWIMFSMLMSHPSKR